MSDKSAYRDYFNEIKDFVKLSTVAKDIGISKSNLSYFMKGPEYDMMLSVDKLNLLCDTIKNKASLI